MEDHRLKAFGRLLGIMDELREKCPWDREQTFESLRNNTIEETYELADALETGNLDDIRQELGDLLLHVVFYAKIGSEQGAFDIGGVADGISDKLVYRHPHVFSDVRADTPDEVSQNWEQLKLREKDKQGKSVLAGVPRGLPAMVKAFRISQKAASAGFDWNEKGDVWEKVKEEIAEVEAELKNASADAPAVKERVTEEFGDLLFALVNAARLYGIDPELALERCNKKFIRRFHHVEERASAGGGRLQDAGLDRLEALWQEAKENENRR